MARFEDIDYTSLTGTFNEVLHGVNEIWHCMTTNAQRLLEQLLTLRSQEDFAACAAQRPLLVVFVIAVTLSCGIPILLFLLFVCFTVLFTFTGFLVIEGTIITIGTMILCGFIIVVMTMMLSLVAILGLTYFGFTEMLSFVQIKGGNDSPSNTLIPKSPAQRELEHSLIARQSNHDD